MTTPMLETVVDVCVGSLMTRTLAPSGSRRHLNRDGPAAAWDDGHRGNGSRGALPAGHEPEARAGRQGAASGRGGGLARGVALRGRALTEGGAGHGGGGHGARARGERRPVRRAPPRSG